MIQLGRRMRRVAAVPMALVVFASGVVVAACTPPSPPDLKGTTGTYGVVVTRNLEIPLRDGRVLRADIYEPTDPDSGERLAGPFPVIIGFTPYGKSGATRHDVPGGNGVNLSLVRHGYMAAAVDVPGTGASDGAFDLFDPAEAVAGAEVVDWAAALPRSSGSVGMLGLSYSAIVQLFTAAEVGPDSPLQAIFPMSATVDPYRDLFVSGGALNTLSPLGLLFGYGVTRTLTPFTEHWGDPLAAMARSSANLRQMSAFEAVMATHMVTNGPRRYDGEWWELRRPERVLQRIADNGVAVYLVGGLYDVFQRGTPLIYSGLQNAAADREVGAPMTPHQEYSDRFRLLTGPWTHSNLGEGMDMTAIQLAWFDRWLKGDQQPSAAIGGGPLQVVEPGGDGYDATAYPLEHSTVERMHLRSGGRLTPEAPGADEPSEEITYSPFGDLCTTSTVQFAAGLGAEQCLGRSRGNEHRPNEALYVTEPLEEDMRLAGPGSLSVELSSTTPETLLAVTIEDVAPDGTTLDLTGGAHLGSLRALDPERSWPGDAGGWIRPYQLLTSEARSPVPVGSAVRYDIEIRPVFTTVSAGHRLGVRVSTADLPHLIPLADAEALRGGTYHLHHRAAGESALNLTVLPARLPDRVDHHDGRER